MQFIFANLIFNASVEWTKEMAGEKKWPCELHLSYQQKARIAVGALSSIRVVLLKDINLNL